MGSWIDLMPHANKVQYYALEGRTASQAPEELRVFDWQVRDKPEANGWLRHPEAILTPTAGWSQNHQCRWSLSPCKLWFKEGRYEKTDKVYLKPGGELSENKVIKKLFFFFFFLHKTLYCCEPQWTSWCTAYTWPWNCLNSTIVHS